MKSIDAINLSPYSIDGAIGSLSIEKCSFTETGSEMELRHLRYFLAAAQSQSFTRASDTLHITQPTLSHQIKQIEDELGMPLFDRVGRVVKLTTAGEIFMGYAKRALREVDPEWVHCTI